MREKIALLIDGDYLKEWIIQSDNLNSINKKAVYYQGDLIDYKIERKEDIEFFEFINCGTKKGINVKLSYEALELFYRDRYENIIIIGGDEYINLGAKLYSLGVNVLIKGKNNFKIFGEEIMDIDIHEERKFKQNSEKNINYDKLFQLLKDSWENGNKKDDSSWVYISEAGSNIDKNSKDYGFKSWKKAIEYFPDKFEIDERGEKFRLKIFENNEL